MEGVIERRRCYPNHIRLAKITLYPCFLQLLEQLARMFADQNGELRSTPVGISWRDHTKRAGRDLIEKEREVPGQLNRLFAQHRHATSLVENRQRGAQRSHRKNRRVAELPRVG